MLVNLVNNPLEGHSAAVDATEARSSVPDTAAPRRKHLDQSPVQILKEQHGWPTPVPMEQLQAALNASNNDVEAASLWLFRMRPTWPLGHTPDSENEVIERERSRRSMVHKSSRDAQIAHDQELRVHRLQLGILNPSTVEDAEHWSSAGILERLAELGATPAQLAALERYQPEASPTIVIDVERAVRLCNELLLEPAEKSDSFNKSTTVTADSLLSAAVAVPQPSP